MREPYHTMLRDLVRRYGEKQVNEFLEEVVRGARTTSAQQRIEGAVTSALSLRGRGKGGVRAVEVAKVVTEGALGFAGLMEVLQMGAQASAPEGPEIEVTVVDSKGRRRPVEEVIDAEFEEVT